MRNLIIVTKNILKRMLKNPINILLHVLLPVSVSLGMFMLMSSGGTSTIPMALADQDQTELSYAVIEAIDSTGKFEIIEASKQEAQDMVAEGDAAFGYAIDAGFEQMILAGKAPEVSVVALSENEGTGWVRAISDFAIQNISDMALAADYDTNTLYTMVENAKSGTVAFSSKQVEDYTAGKTASQSAMGLYIMVLMISTFSIAFKVLQEKEQGTFARIGISPVNSKIYTLANVAANMLVATLQTGIVVAVLVWVGKVNFFVNPFMVFFIFWVFAICSVSLGLMLAAFAKRSDVAGTMLSLVLSPSCMLAGCFWSIEFMPDYLRKAAYITPQRWTLDALQNMQNGGSFLSTLPSLLVVLAFALLFFLVAAYRFRSAEQRLG